MERYCIFDLASLRFAIDPDGGNATVRSQGGEVLGLVSMGDERDQRNVAFAACDAALDCGTVLREDEAGIPSPHKIALYNPLTGQVAVGAVPLTRVFSAGAPLVLPVEGHNVTLNGSELLGDHLALFEVAATAQTAARAAAMHPDASR